jgi:hypothetical protein
MNLPPLSAEVSLYHSKGYYRTNAGLSFLESSTRRIARIYPTQSEITSTMTGGNGIITVPGTEIITVHSCPPGYEDQGGHCVPIGGPTLTFTDGGSTQGGGGTGSGGQQQPPPGWKLCPGTKAEQDACSEWVVDKPGGGKIGGGQIVCDEKGKVFCCIQDGEGSWRCLPPSSLPGRRRLPPVVAGGAARWNALG